MRWLLALFCGLMLMAAVALPAAAASAKKKTTSRAKFTARKSSSKKTSSRKSSRRTAARSRRPVTQRTPSPERYREIQQALAAKGYFTSEADGNWGASSVEALKRFQQDQSIEPSGKINSLSLIALGLGPQYERAAQTLPVETAPPSP